jgi:hypothetical protein
MRARAKPETPTGSHTENEDHPWTIQIPDHPPRTDSPEYLDSRREMNRFAAALPDFIYGKGPYQDHHSGGLWLKDAQGWFLVRNLAGIEWSAQYCADPAKVDHLRLNARRLYAAFPEAADELGIRELLDTPITDAAGVARWTDSICNASVPLPAAVHVGVLPGAPTGGIHHYPSPIAEIDLFKRDDFTLWVEPPAGGVAAVVPMAPPGSGDGRTRLLFAAVAAESDGMGPIEQLVARPPMGAPRATGKKTEDFDPLVLPADNPLSQLAFAKQR